MMEEHGQRADAAAKGAPRMMGLDFGAKTVGVAVSDPLGMTAQPLETIVREREDKLRRTLARIEELIRAYNVGTLVLGLPKNMDNRIGARAEKTIAFQETLRRRTGLPVVLWDERLTTAQARRVLEEAGIAGQKHKQYLDAMAAALILESYMSAENAAGTGDGRTAEENVE